MTFLQISFIFLLLHLAYCVRFARPENRITLERVNGKIFLNESKIFNQVVNSIDLAKVRRSCVLCILQQWTFGLHKYQNLQELGRGTWTGLIWLRMGTGGGVCKCGMNLSVP